MGNDKKKGGPSLVERIEALEQRADVVDDRLGLDHAEIAADEAAALERGAEAAPLSEPASPDEDDE